MFRGENSHYYFIIYEQINSEEERRDLTEGDTDRGVDRGWGTFY